MAKGQQRDPKREAFWRGALARFNSSGLSVRGFCARERLSEPSFYGWRRVVGQRDGERKRTPPAFVPVMVGEERNATDSGITVEVGHAAGARAVTLRLPAALPMGQVAELVRAIAAVPASGCGAVEGRS
jgi:hypothetical protein